MAGKEETVRRPTVNEGLKRVIAEADFQDIEVKRLEVTFRANAEVVYRGFPADGGDSVGGVLEGR